MHYVWLNRLFPQNNLTTVDGRTLQILNPGTLNNGAGPDFFNAAVVIDGQKWVGNVEIHLRASDWHRHHHTEDPAYQTVILHVVDNDDAPIYRTNGHLIPQFVMQCSSDLNRHFHSLADFSVETLPCLNALHAMPKVYLTDWVTALGYERLHDKVERILAVVAATSGDWHEAAYVTIARALGFGTNSDPFERLARSTPLRILRRHADDTFIVESILLGQAGLIEHTAGESYGQRMAQEYNFFAAKFGMKAPESLAWKFSRTRPQNSPVRRISYLAGLISDTRDAISSILMFEDLDDIYKLFFGEHNHSRLSRTSIDLLIINAVIPLAYSFANYRGDFARASEVVEKLHEIKAESNRFTNMFQIAGVPVRSAFESQAIVQLRRQYCEKRKCLYCRIGHRHLSSCALRK